MKKFFAILMSVALMLSLAVPVMATSGTVKNDTGRTYIAYQIFKATQAEGSAVLGDIAWGDGIADTFLAALNDLTVNNEKPFATCTTAADVAGVLKAENDRSPIANAFANLAEKHLKGEGTTVAANENKSLDSGYYLLVDQTNVSTGHVAKNPALLQVTNDAQLNIIDKSGVPTIDKTVNDTDLNIGDEVTFTLTATMPSNFEGYDSYKVIFHDTMSKGLTYVAESINVSVQGFTWDVVEGVDGTTITVTNDNVLDNGVTAGSTITVTYKATLNSDAVIGTEGNPNEVYLEYSSDPDWEGTPGSTDEPTGETPEDEVKVYTWDMSVLKYADGDKNKVLEGVKFILLDKAENKIAKVENGRLISWNSYTEDMDVTAYELVTDKDGKIAIAGLETGTYCLHETYALPGYNTLPNDVEVVIIGATKTEDSETLTYATVVAEVENNSGATLPETGGVGTTIFYIVGGVMVAAAVVLLITKKRMSAEG